MWNAVDGAQAYHYEIVGVKDDVVDTSYVLIDNCLLESNKEYSWRVQACCDSECQNPGPWSNTWTFKTSLAPELLSPEKDTEDVNIPVTLDWCDVEEALSYYVMVYKNGDFYFPGPVEKEGDTLDSEITLGPAVFTKDTTYDWEAATCLTEDNTQCGVECGEDLEGSECGDYSQRWKFTTGEISLPTPEITSPESSNGIAVVNLSDYLSWKPVGIEGTASYLYEIKEGSTIVASSSVSVASTSVSFEEFWEELKFDETYTAIVKSCWDEEGEKCEEEGGEVSFKTTGAIPTFNEEGSGPADNANNVVIPVRLNWDDMPGAASYYYSVGEATATVKKSEVLIDYPTLKQSLSYNWEVKTCADEKGEVCGEAAARSFTTFTLSPPSDPDPPDGGELKTSQKYLGWGEVLGAKFYQYKVDFEGEEKISPTIVSTNSALLPINKMDLGNYTWWIQSCLDKECEEVSSLAGPWHFTLVEGESFTEKGIVPCGRNYDDPRTPWNEKESCQIKHFFIMLKNIIDFVLWRLGMIVLTLLTIATGVIYYFSTGAPQTMVKVKTIWKSAGTGYAVVFVGWIIINLLLAILGYQPETFGDWWQITF
jgi:hypothetical protein